MALLCPLCLGVDFTSEETLLYDLIAFSSRNIICPLCSETVKGFDKFTVHLCCHVLKCDSNSNPINLNPNQNNIVSLNEKLKGINLRKNTNNKLDLNSTNIESCQQSINSSNDVVNLEAQNHPEVNYLMQFSKSDPRYDLERNLATNEGVWPLPENTTGDLETSTQLPASLLLDDSAIEMNQDEEIAAENENILNVGFSNESEIHFDKNKTILSVDFSNVSEIHFDDSESNENYVDTLALATQHDDAVWPLHENTANNLGNLQLPESLLFDNSATPLNQDENKIVPESANILHVDFSNDNVPISVINKNDREMNPAAGNINYQNTYDCASCSTSFPKSSMLKLHNELMHGDGIKNVLSFKYQCHQCQKKFKIKGSLLIHQQVAHRLQNDESTLCKIPTEDNQQSKDSQYYCNVCFKFFKKEYYLNQHLKTHDGKKWTCEECGKMFSTRYFLKKHKLLHTGETPYSCSICDKSFTFQQSYHRHMLYHNDEKPYSCDDCGKSFKELSTLYNHQRIHTGEKPYSCHICGKSFRQRVACLVHSRIHSKSPPFKCSQCQRSFKYKVSLRSHKCNPSTEDVELETLPFEEVHFSRHGADEA